MGITETLIAERDVARQQLRDAEVRLAIIRGVYKKWEEQNDILGNKDRLEHYPLLVSDIVYDFWQAIKQAMEMK